jgi:hypothetical protein
MPCPLTPDQILELAPKKSRPLLVEANTIAYFGNLFVSLKSATSNASLIASPAKPAHKAPSGTASARNPS